MIWIKTKTQAELIIGCKLSRENGFQTSLVIWPFTPLIKYDKMKTVIK